MDHEMHKMQQEAIQRVNEMQSRAQKHLQQEEMPSAQNRNSAEKKKQNAMASSQQKSTMAAATSADTLFDGLMQDSERTLILMLTLLLFTENADTSVIFSLLYLLL